MNSYTPPSADLFLAHLGKPLDIIDQAVFRFAREPDFTVPEHSPIGGIFFRKLGFSFTFCSPEFYHSDELATNRPPIITNVQIYSGDVKYPFVSYAGNLPFALEFGDSRELTLKKLGTPNWQHPFVAPFTFERWDMGDRWLLLEYSADMDKIIMIQIGLTPNKRRRSLLPRITQPDIFALTHRLGSNFLDLIHDANFLGIDLSGVPKGAIDPIGSYEVDALSTHGIELYFRTAIGSERTLNVLSGARYIRKGVYGSVGFDGALPKNLLFEDSPEIVIKKIGGFPVTGKADALSGYYVWNLHEFLLHVGFSVMERRINRIFVAAHPYYSPSLLESPRLTSPLAKNIIFE
ncbi:hypothetical protein LXA47_29840 [Massilia sp. P8910]|uniref:hypothetical protein n=1 Tax=Massilia antarctica TaxID=2765360 RepID=UPI001E513A5D|nr:hypothetical protein [Massilia antarctica]MCE3607770.1 hypothetical protein [Massilia antarctica]